MHQTTMFNDQGIHSKIYRIFLAVRRREAKRKLRRMYHVYSKVEQHISSIESEMKKLTLAHP
jgi:hypothetical protein